MQKANVGVTRPPIPSTPYDPAEQGDPLHNEAPAESHQPETDRDSDQSQPNAVSSLPIE